MLNNDLIEIINSGEAWAFVGSGPSIDSGLPTWSTLLNRVGDRLRSEDFPIPAPHKLQDLQPSVAFQCLEDIAGRKQLEAAVKAELARSAPGGLVAQLCDLPFAGYITTNYDTIIEDVLGSVGERGWIRIGNTPDECRKIGGGINKVIWHIHGTIEETVPSKLTLTEHDYDELYLEASVFRRQLEALLATRRVVFIGFGFNDIELLRLLKRVRNIANPARPAYAFLSRTDVEGRIEDRLERTFAQSVRTIFYRVVGDDHSRLNTLLEAYGAFAVRRSVRFGKTVVGCPSYDPDTTSLLIYNRLVLGSGAARVSSEEALRVLLRSRILALAKFRGELDRDHVVAELTECARLLGIGAFKDISVPVEEAVKSLVEDGLVEISGEKGKLVPTGSGLDLVSDNAATAARLREQFQQSLRDRVAEFVTDSDARERLASALEAFLEQTIRRRGLGIAMAWARPDQRDLHVTALLQSLPSFMDQLRDVDEAAQLSRITRMFFSSPSPEEKAFLGLALQAQFGLHFLGYHADSSKVREQVIANTFYVLDSDTVIPAIADGCVGQAQANLLIRRLRALGGAVSTTSLLLDEVAEHAHWARARARREGANVDSLAVLKGEVGGRVNAFLDGFVNTLASGGVTSFRAYISGSLGASIKTDQDVLPAIRSKVSKFGTAVHTLNEWLGFKDDDFGEREDLSLKIAFRRKARNTFKHDRQVLAEAEVLVVIRRIRGGIYRSSDATYDDAYFVSHSRVIDEVEGPGRPITITPESLLLLLETLVPGPEEELGLLTDSLLSELSMKGLRIVDESKLYLVFGGLINASRQSLAAEVAAFRDLIADRYGESGLQAFSEVSDLDAPIVEAALNRQLIGSLRERLVESEEARRREASRSRLTDKERIELARLKAEKKQREAEAKRKKRRSDSRPSRRRRRKRRG